MSGPCTISNGMGAIRDVLATVDCSTRDFARLGYDSLAGASQFQSMLTALLVIYVAAIGYRLLFASAGMRLSDGPIIALKIGAILALVTNWNVFQLLVFDTASRAPTEIAGLITAPLQEGNSLAAHPLTGLQASYDALSSAAQAFGKSSAPTAQTYASQSTAAAEALAFASGVLFMTSAGLISVATIAIGVLTAIGPLFIALFLFLETRGLFAGWVRALLASALTLLCTWALIVMMLAALEPWLIELTAQQAAGRLDVQTAITTASVVFVFAAAEAGLVVASIMVARGFSVGFARRLAERRTDGTAGGAAKQTPFELVTRPARLAEQMQQLDASATWANRPAAAARAVGASTVIARTAEAPRLGMVYRRMAVMDDSRLRVARLP